MWFLVCSKSQRYVDCGGRAVFVRCCQYLSVLDGISSVCLDDGGRYFPRIVGKHVPDCITSHRKVSGGWRGGWVSSWRFKRKRSWSYRNKTRNFPGGTRETHEKCQNIQCPRRHSNSAFLEYKSDLLLYLSACLEEWSDCDDYCHVGHDAV